MIDEPLQDPPEMWSDDAVCYLVEDDFVVRSSLAESLEQSGLRVKPFPTAEAVLDDLDDDGWGCLVADISLPSMSGIDLARRIRHHAAPLEVVIVSGQASLPLAIEALDLRVHAFLEKPVQPPRLVEAVRGALAEARARRTAQLADRRIRQALTALTEREREVAALVVQGLTNKEIARRLAVSHRTVEVHRHRCMEKLRVKTLPDLVRLVGTVDF